MTAESDQMTWRDRNDFKTAVRRWAQRIKVRPQSVRVQAMSRKWASCSTAGILTFSTDLLSMPRDFGESVIVHELIHLRVPNHGKLFRSLVLSFMNGRLVDVAEDRAL